MFAAAEGILCLLRDIYVALDVPVTYILERTLDERLDMVAMAHTY